MNSDTQKTLQILRERKSLGVHSFELNKLVGTTRSAARVQDLKDMGHSISAVREKMGDAVGVRYYLVSEKIEPISPNGYRWTFKGNTAVRVQI